MQLSDNKYALLDALKKKLPNGYENWINLGHINALVLFHQPIQYDVANIQYDLSHPASKWFNISDLENISQTLMEITSRETNIRGERLDILLQALGCEDLFYADEKKEAIDSAIDAQDQNILANEENSFSDLYYKKAMEIDKIKVMIVGQDPYPTNSNGVAFCKDSYYELFQPDCSGGIVLNSMGISKERAREISRKNPKNLFYDLLDNFGICFINVFHKLYDSLSIEDVRSAAEEARLVNLPLLEKSENIILLGKGKTKSTFERYYPEISYNHVLIHPSPKARTGNEAEWSETWESQKLSKLILSQC